MALPGTIAALASGSGRSARAMIRLSGPDVRWLLTDAFDPAVPLARACRGSRLRLTESLRLPVLLLVMPGPASYTGEDTIEIVLPGNPALVDRVFASLLAQTGIREATPGEFSARAYLNGRLTIEQAEGVAAMIAARSDEQLLAASDLLRGGAGDRYRRWAEDSATLLALVEAGIDFTDQEDVVAITNADLADRTNAIAGEIRSYLGADSGAEHRSQRATVALAGAPNAGKSTLFNALLGCGRAVVSEVAGTTRDVLTEPLDLSADVPGGPVVSLIDLAGLDAALDTTVTGVDAAAQRAGITALADADVLVHCDPTGRFRDPIPTSSSARRSLIRVRTKADLPGAADSDAIAVCAIDRWNLAALRRAIADAAWEGGGGRGSRERASTVPARHRRALGHAAEMLESAAALARSADRSPSPELLAQRLRAALDSLGEITGRISPDDVIGRIFATFCIGK